MSSVLLYVGMCDLWIGVVWGGVCCDGVNLCVLVDVGCMNLFVEFGVGVLFGCNVECNVEVMLCIGFMVFVYECVMMKFSMGFVGNVWYYV